MQILHLSMCTDDDKRPQLVILVKCKISRKKYRAYILPREDKGDREGIPHTHPIP